jgi:amino acid transporter
VVHPTTRTPARALVAFVAAGLGVIGVWAVVHAAGVGTGSMDPVGLYAECSTLGTVVILFVYLLTMVSLPVYAWRRHRDRFSVVRHVVLPLLGAAALVVPFVSLCTPGQPSPYDAFPFVALGVVVAAFGTGWVVIRRRP